MYSKKASMSSPKLIGPALPPMFTNESDEDSDDQRGCKYLLCPAKLQCICGKSIIC